jgi:hypothetical protein
MYSKILFEPVKSPSRKQVAFLTWLNCNRFFVKVWAGFKKTITDTAVSGTTANGRSFVIPGSEWVREAILPELKKVLCEDRQLTEV